MYLSEQYNEIIERRILPFDLKRRSKIYIIRRAKSEHTRICSKVLKNYSDALNYFQCSYSILDKISIEKKILYLQEDVKRDIEKIKKENL